MIKELMALRSAPVIEDYTGPVLFEKQAAAEILSRGFVKMLAAKRSTESYSPQFETIAGKTENPFLGKVGIKVIGESISVRAEPTKSNYNGAPLLGSYEVDEEGVKARDVSLVESGILKDFMMSRSPVKGFNKSNGHFRGATTSPSVVEFSSPKASKYEELRKKLIAEINGEGLKYGYIIKSILPPELARDGKESLLSMLINRISPNSSEFGLSRPVSVYRIYPDGKEELVRGAEFGRMSIKLFRSVIGISDDAFSYNYPIGSSGLPFDIGISWPGGAGSGNYASIITPSILISEVDVSKSSGNYRKPPIVGHPPQGK